MTRYAFIFSKFHFLSLFLCQLNQIQVQCCVERAIELTLNQLSDTGDDDMLLRDALRDMIEVLVDDQV